MAMVALSFFIILMPPITSALSCPSSCSFISPVPYPFGAAPGCGAPGFQLSNCSVTPQWNLRLSETLHIYYVQRINPYPNSSQRRSALSLGYGGSIILTLVPPSRSTPFCETSAPLYPVTAFSTSNLYTFNEASLTFYQDKYFLFNCTGLTLQAPPSGNFTPSSPSCNKYVKHCNISTLGRCIEYAPYKDLYLSTLLTTYNCTSFRRFIVANEDDPVESWIAGIQFAWGPVKDADSCRRCQDTGGTCGYNTLDSSFLCYCGDRTNEIGCDGKQSGRKGVILGASCAVISLLVIASIAFCFHYRHYYWLVFGNRKHLKLDGICQAPIEFPYGLLAAATKNFSTEIGRGAFGKVYKGVLPGGSEVAVKVLDASASQGNEQFLNEVATIGNIHHLNVARLFGFCFSKSKQILVYEYISNGSLDKHLFLSDESSDKVALSWTQRYEIAVGIARGLCYMHEECRNCIIHCDIKPQNVLLDAAYCPKISDFGLAKLLTREESRVVLTQARGTPGYVAPEFWSLGSGPLTSKFDVYSYGMVLLEIVRGKRIFHRYDPFSLQESDEEVDEWTSVSIDRRLLGDADLEQVDICMRVAVWCIQEDPSVRPTMSKVVQYLQGSTIVPAKPPSPFRKMDSHKGTESEQTSLFSISTEGV